MAVEILKTASMPILGTVFFNPDCKSVAHKRIVMAAFATLVSQRDLTACSPVVQWLLSTTACDLRWIADLYPKNRRIQTFEVSVCNRVRMMRALRIVDPDLFAICKTSCVLHGISNSIMNDSQPDIFSSTWRMLVDQLAVMLLVIGEIAKLSAEIVDAIALDMDNKFDVSPAAVKSPALGMQHDTALFEGLIKCSVIVRGTDGYEFANDKLNNLFSIFEGTTNARNGLYVAEEHTRGRRRLVTIYRRKGIWMRAGTESVFDYNPSVIPMVTGIRYTRTDSELPVSFENEFELNIGLITDSVMTDVCQTARLARKITVASSVADKLLTY